MLDYLRLKKGRSSLHKWTCPECGLNARIGIKRRPRVET
jgi:RNase P subunit RPR2